MKIFNKIRKYIISTCISFTVVSLIQICILNEEAVVDRYLPLYIFFVCIVVNIVIFIIDRLHIKNEKLRIGLHIISVIIVVFIANDFIFTWFYDTPPVMFNIINIIISILYLIFTYGVVYILVILKNKADEKSINKQIKLRRK